MAQIIVTAESDLDQSLVMWRERVTPADLESEHFCSQLLERLNWAVSDAARAERSATKTVTQPAKLGHSVEREREPTLA